MKALIVIFWICAAVVFYTYLGYGLLVWLIVKIKEAVHPVSKKEVEQWPDASLLIAAYNEQDCVPQKMENCRSLKYKGKLKIVWVTDGSTDGTRDLLAQYPDATVLHSDARRGKTNAVNRAMKLIDTPVTILTDANTFLNADAVQNLVETLLQPGVGCVSGEKRVMSTGSGSQAETEGLYWKYESFLKSLDSRLYSTQGTAGELYAIYTDLWQDMPDDTLLDDFVCSMTIAGMGHRIAYCKEAYAMETASASVAEEGKRKKRIAAGGWQSVWRLRYLLNPFRYPVLSFQFASHRASRWILCPIMLLLLIPVNIAIVLMGGPLFYTVVLALQILFYAAAAAKVKVPYYFTFMNVNALQAPVYLFKHRGTGVWEKAKRA